MISIIDQIFKNNGFSTLKQENLEQKDSDSEISLRKIYTNKFDEMYLVVEGKLGKDTLGEILRICLEIEENVTINKKYKSNWVLILLVPIEQELSWNQRKRILFIEENKYFCRKYVMWYTPDEKEKLMKICKEDYSTANINSIVEDYNIFMKFKEMEDKGYDCLSRIFIKLPFLNLTNLKTTDRTMMDYIEKELNSINEKLFEKIERDDLESIENDIILSEKEKNNIDKKLEALTKEKE